MPQNYGTNGQNGTIGAQTTADEESQPLLRRDSQAPTASSKIAAYMTQDINTKWGDIALLVDKEGVIRFAKESRDVIPNDEILQVLQTLK